MSGDPFDQERGFASPPCFAHELEENPFDPLAVDPEQARDVARWRKAERERLLAARRSIPVAERRRLTQALIAHLRRALRDRFPEALEAGLGGFWPIKGEPDLRPLLTELHARGVEIALPLVETRAAPLTYRRWTPETRMVRGHWRIPVPPPQAPELRPGLLLAPLVGWDPGGWRLGYGGGYFDRTLAAASPRPAVIGVGLEAARLRTIYPQPHDIAMDLVVTETGSREPDRSRD